MIRSTLNKSLFKDEKFLQLLPLNNTNATFEDYGNITNQIHEKVNDEYKERDRYQENKTVNKSINTSNLQDEDINVTE